MKIRTPLRRAQSRLRNARIGGMRALGVSGSPAQRIAHFSFHKNLTGYFSNVARDFAYATGRTEGHFQSFRARFEANPGQDIRSLNNHFVDVASLMAHDPTLRCSLFLRDPRDLVVSGYHYHKRGAESWCNVPDPTPDTLLTVNMSRPEDMMRPGESVASCLERLPLEEGLRFEIALRAPHWEAMRGWARAIEAGAPLQVATYDEIMADDQAAFGALAAHYGFTDEETKLWLDLAERHSARNSSSRHIRNPSSGQWAKTFPEALAAEFADTYGDILEAFGWRSGA